MLKSSQSTYSLLIAMHLAHSCSSFFNSPYQNSHVWLLKYCSTATTAAVVIITKTFDKFLYFQIAFKVWKQNSWNVIWWVEWMVNILKPPNSSRYPLSCEVLWAGALSCKRWRTATFHVCFVFFTTSSNQHGKLWFSVLTILVFMKIVIKITSLSLKQMVIHFPDEFWILNFSDFHVINCFFRLYIIVLYNHVSPTNHSNTLSLDSWKCCKINFVVSAQYKFWLTFKHFGINLVDVFCIPNCPSLVWAILFTWDLWIHQIQVMNGFQKLTLLNTFQTILPLGF